MNEYKAARIVKLAEELISFVKQREQDTKLMATYAPASANLTFEEDKEYIKKLLKAIEGILEQ